MDPIVKRKVEAAWPGEEERRRAIDLLQQYDGYDSRAGQTRVHLAMLKEADGSLDQLALALEMANRDFRDVVAAAEYPEAMRTTRLNKASLSSSEQAELRAIQQRDREQYKRWLEGEG